MESIIFNCLINNLNIAIFWKDKHLIFRGCNKAFALQFGYQSPADIIGKSDYDFSFSPEHIKTYHQDDMKIIQTGIKKLEYEEIQRQQDGSQKVLLVNKVPFFNKNGKIAGVMGLYTDITARKNMEENLKQAKILAEAASHAKSEFIANMSHDIRTPLCGMINMSEFLEQAVQDKKSKEYAYCIHASSIQLLNMLNDILEIIKTDNIHTIDLHEEPFSIRQSLKELKQLETPAIQMKSLQLHIDIDDAVPICLIGDKHKIERVLLNLLGNSIKFTTEGHITIQVKEMSRHAYQSMLQFKIIDTGIGIPETLQNKIFDQFYRIDPTYKGIIDGYGIGLHLAKRYIECMGSEIKVKSTVGQGSTFYFTLPFKIGDADQLNTIMPTSSHYTHLSDMQKRTMHIYTAIHEVNKEVANKADHVSHQSKLPHILLIEDNIIALRSMEIFMESMPVSFISMTDAEHALQYAKTQPVDAIITDLGLPGLSGLDLAKQIRVLEKGTSRKPMYIAGLTAHTGEQEKTNCIQSGMDEVFVKPASPAIIQHIINKITSPHQPHIELNTDLPDTEPALFQLDAFPLLDIEKAVQLLGSKTLLLELLKTLVHEQIPIEKKKIKAAHDNHDWVLIANLAHKMKGGACYCGTVRLQFACQYLERYRKAGYEQYLEALYQQLMHVCDETIHVVKTQLRSIAKVLRNDRI